MYIFITEIVNNLTDNITSICIEFRVGISHRQEFNETKLRRRRIILKLKFRMNIFDKKRLGIGFILITSINFKVNL